jgi:hypothetical protein
VVDADQLDPIEKLWRLHIQKHMAVAS